jgi:hypothetical protein
MKVTLKKNLKSDAHSFVKGTIGWVWCCLLHNDSFLVNFGEIRVEVGRNDLDFSQTK